MTVVVGEVEITGDVRIAPNSVIEDGLVTIDDDLAVRVSSFYFDFGVTKGKFGGALNQAVADNNTSYVFLDSAGALQINTTGYPSTSHIRLARVITSGGIITRIVLERAFLSSGATSSQLISQVGEYTVPSAAAVGDAVYMTGGFTADRADNSAASTAPAMAMVVGKPTATTATLAYGGVVEIPGGAMTPSAPQFLGTTGGLVEAGGLPTAAGSVVQQLGIALDADTLLFDPQPEVVL